MVLKKGEETRSKQATCAAVMFNSPMNGLPKQKKGVKMMTYRQLSSLS